MSDRIPVTACEAVLLDLLAQVRKFCEEQGEADFETGAAEAMKRQIVGQQVEPYLQRQLDRVVSAYAIKADATRQQEVGSGLGCKFIDDCKNGTRTACMVRGCALAAAPSTPEKAGGVSDEVGQFQRVTGTLPNGEATYRFAPDVNAPDGAQQK